MLLFSGKIVVHAEKFKGICYGLKGIIFKIQVWIPIARSLRSRRIQSTVYIMQKVYFFCKHSPGLDAKFKISKLSHRMCAAHA